MPTWVSLSIRPRTPHPTKEKSMRSVLVNWHEIPRGKSEFLDIRPFMDKKSHARHPEKSRVVFAPAPSRHLTRPRPPAFSFLGNATWVMKHPRGFGVRKDHHRPRSSSHPEEDQQEGQSHDIVACSRQPRDAVDRNFLLP